MTDANGADAPAKALGRRLRVLRRRAGLTQEQLAERARVSTHTVSNLERGAHAAPRVDTVALVADALGLAGAERADLLATLDAGPAEPLGSPTGAPYPGLPPPPADALLGREEELAALAALLDDPAARVVTIVGPGGVGKTRLALEVGRAASAGGRPVAWAALDSLGSSDDVLPAIARAVGAAGPAQAHGDPVLRIAEAVAGRDVLLVADNCEHVIEAAADLAAVIAAAPRLTVLATSREALRIGGERRSPLAPLPVPAAGDDEARIAANPAAALFLERARLHGEDTPGLEDVRRIVTAVDGVPLAIELAAAQVDDLSVGTVADLLDRSALQVLGTGRRDVPRRLRSMDDAVRWSYDLVGDGARRLLRVLSIFRGGADLGALEQVCARLGEPDLIRSLPALVRASLASEAKDGHGRSRIRTLSPILLFAVAELEAAGERPAAEAAHRAVMLDHARRARDLVSSRDAPAGLAAFDRERDNLVAALDRAVHAGAGADAIELASAMAWWWENRSEPVEGLRWLEVALAVPGADARPEDAVMASAVAFIFAYFVGRHDRCAVHAAEMERIARAAGREDLVGAARVVAGDLAWGVHGDLETAAARYDEGLARLEPFGPSVWLGQARTRAADAATERGDPTAALGHIDRAIAVRDGLGQVVFLATALMIRGAALAALGRDAEAREAFLASVEQAVRLGQPLFTAHGLVRLACLDATRGDAARRRRSPRLLGAALGLMDARRIALDPTQEPFIAEARAALAAELGADAVDRLVAEGRQLPMAEAAALARQE